MCKIAVLMSTYNGERYLSEQIDSILKQKTRHEIDLIIRDDGSTDKTIEILEKYSGEGKLKYYKGNNIGAAKGFISLLKGNRGYDYYAFSDQDDVWNEDKIENGIKQINGLDGPVLYCTNCEIVDSNLQGLGRNTHRKKPSYTLESVICLASCAQGCTSIFSNDLAMIVQNNKIPRTFIMHDSLLTCLCALVGGKIIYDDRPSMKYRMHNSNVYGVVTSKQGKGKVIKDRINEITKKDKVSLYEQARSIAGTYKKKIPDNNMKRCKAIIKAERSIIARVGLVLNPRLRHDTINMTITRKLKILFGNG